MSSTKGPRRSTRVAKIVTDSEIMSQDQSFYEAALSQPQSYEENDSNSDSEVDSIPSPQKKKLLV